MDLDKLKLAAIADCKTASAVRLSHTDWYVVRKMDNGAEVPAGVAQYRAATRDYSNDLEESINAVTDIESLQQIVPDWPKTAEEILAMAQLRAPSTAESNSEVEIPSPPQAPLKSPLS